MAARRAGNLVRQLSDVVSLATSAGELVVVSIALHRRLWADTVEKLPICLNSHQKLAPQGRWEFSAEGSAKFWHWPPVGTETPVIGIRSGLFGLSARSQNIGASRMFEFFNIIGSVQTFA